MSKDRLRSIHERLTERTDPGEWGNEAPHAEAIKEAIHTYWQLILVAWTCIVLFLCVLFFNQGGFVDFSASGDIHANSEFSLTVAADGETIYTAAKNVSNGLRNVLTSTTYPSPEAAMEAVEPVSGQPAYAHAVNLCWHETYSKLSNQTGTSQHRTWWRKDYNGYRYTTTVHEVLSGGYWVTTDTFKYRIDKRYC